jgi:predicted metal-dependent enzyme (double-stranded beta helix superfamily)
MGLGRLRRFVTDFTAMLGGAPGEAEILSSGGRLLSDLVAHDDWLPDEFAAVSGQGYAQYLLHCDSAERFSVVSFAWAPGAGTPAHDHTVWGLVGVLRGAELSQRLDLTPDGLAPRGAASRLVPGQVEAVSPAIGDIHAVTNALEDEASVSIHVYGANIGAVQRHLFDPAGRACPFVSGYSNPVMPNFWGAERRV